MEKPIGLLVIDGLDGTGKSTLAALLAAMGAQVYESPVEPWSRITDAVVSASDPRTRLLYFLAANRQAAISAADAGSSGLCVIVRHTWSTFAYHAALMGEHVVRLRDAYNHLLDDLPGPNLSVLLSVDYDEYRRRLVERATPTATDRMIGRDSDLWLTIADNFRLLSATDSSRTVMAVDTTATAPDEILKRVLGRLGA